MFLSRMCCLVLYIYYATADYEVTEDDMHFRIVPGGRTCFFERAKAGQSIDLHYKVIDGQHGDLDIIFEVIDPKGFKIVADYKKPENNIIFSVPESGDYAFCMDNRFSKINSKLVFVAITMEEGASPDSDLKPVTQNEDGPEEEVLVWQGFDNGEPYYLEIRYITFSIKKCLRRIMHSRHLLENYSSIKSRDSYHAAEDKFKVDMWSSFQIVFMLIVGVIQVYMIKNLFNSSFNKIHPDNK